LTAESRGTPKALEGVKVVAFVQAMTGPLTTSTLAAYGAEVVRIETGTRLEWHRQSGPYIGGVADPDKSVPLLFVNAGEYGVTLNLKAPGAMEVMQRIIRWADVVVENFSGKTMSAMGLGYDDLVKIQPDIIMLSAAIYGQTGPYAHVRGYGITLTALTGLPAMTGYPGGRPQFPGMALTDFIAPKTNVLAIAAALDYRRRTGKGQYIDAAQAEAAFPLLTSALLYYQSTGREPERIGNASALGAPHGVYRCLGEKRWCAIGVFTETEWRSFGKAIGNPVWTKGPEFATVESRIQNAEKLDLLVEEWTSTREAQGVMDLLQAAGVAAGVVQSGQDLDRDPQLRHRGMFWKLEQPDIGHFVYTGQPAILSKTPCEVTRAPRLGEHNEYFYTRVLGYSDEQFVQLMADGVFE
jgi:benzylsuccinate CoA-transferase BbsF subunit